MHIKHTTESEIPSNKWQTTTIPVANPDLQIRPQFGRKNKGGGGGGRALRASPLGSYRPYRLTRNSPHVRQSKAVLDCKFQSVNSRFQEIESGFFFSGT